jgi:hypothetical protein
VCWSHSIAATLVRRSLAGVAPPLLSLIHDDVDSLLPVSLQVTLSESPLLLLIHDDDVLVSLQVTLYPKTFQIFHNQFFICPKRLFIVFLYERVKTKSFEIPELGARFPGPVTAMLPAAERAIDRHLLLPKELKATTRSPHQVSIGEKCKYIFKNSGI